MTTAAAQTSPLITGNDSPALVSVVMPVRDEEDFIAQSLGAILSQDYPHDRLEIIIADGMSGDSTRSIINKLATASDISVTIIDNAQKITPTGLNAAICRAKGYIIVRVDGHAVIAEDYVSLCVSHLLESGADCVGGIIESIGNNYLGQTISLSMGSPWGVGNSCFRIENAGAPPRPTDTVPFGAFRKEVFSQIGLFNEKMVRHQDYEFNYRLRKAGGKIMLLPAAKASYYVRSSLASLFRQFWQYGFYKGQFLRKYPDSLRIRHLIPPLFVISLIVSSILGFWLGESRTLFIMILLLYCAFLIGAAVSIFLKGKGKYAPLFPVILLIMHVTWGAGLLVGMLISSRGKN